ncbi:Electron transfer flavoprotein subunit beta [Candidatus Kinetoplastibacterium sorsogonicusi]|uniref:Electron transfer flavoprotein subunit beta n=1 Tax=Candidatus Kinetoplastidibacterium kentomonadis TaxID=1576550 RepID=A0A3Q8F6P3_9PROT|nr:electron transfer flavoprotein subunit beta/FixA family protein [Candidatus Kinetoplastibacterium sorsogonicusi]AWD32523.1 Electron transfer flavoprotein subunit beta [Candidatus Kinetoplastibacterium sorsogonicusi]
MKILIPIKMVVDHNIAIQLKNDKSSLDIENLKMSINPFDEHAIEEAIRLKENGIAKEIISISCGSLKAQQILKTSMSMGIDRSILFECDSDLEPLAIAKILKYAIELEKPDLVIMGKQAIDDDSSQTGQMLAGLLNWPQATFVNKIENINNNEIIIKREANHSYEILSIKLPAIITVDLSINEPRYISLTNIIKAKKKSLTIIDVKKLNLNLINRLKINNFQEQILERSVQLISNVDELIEKIKNNNKG